MFYLVLTFNYIANELFPNLKNIMQIKKKTSSNPLTLARVKPYNYKQDGIEKDIKISLLFLFSNKVCLPAFIQLAYNIDNISYKLFMALPVYQARAKNSRDKLQKEYSNTFGKQAIYHLFPYKVHCVLCYHNLFIVAMEQVMIRQYYAQLKLDKQTEFHIDNIEKEIEHFHILIKIEL